MNIQPLKISYEKHKSARVASSLYLAKIFSIAVLCSAIATQSYAANKESDNTPSANKIKPTAIVNIAVAANFKSTLQLLVDHFLSDYRNNNKPNMRIISGSTGALYAQITQGAPFDIFFAADTKRPKQLQKDKLIKNEKLSIYAKGQIALVVNKKNFSNASVKDTCPLLFKGQDIVKQISAHKDQPQVLTLAIANPRTAPYGNAAIQLFESMPEAFADYRIVRGKNILHAQQLLLNGNADIAALSSAQASHPSMVNFLFCPIDQQLYSSIEQSMAIIEQNQRKTVADDIVLAFYQYIKSADAQSIIANQGYINNGIAIQ